MADLTMGELTVLGLVLEAPRHGYDLERLIEKRGIRQWADIGFSSIYYLLTRLERRGLVHVPEEPEAAKSRRVYHATEEGRQAAVRAVADTIALPSVVPQPLSVALANLPLLDPDSYAAALRTRRAHLDARIASVEAACRAQEPLPVPAREVFSYTLSLMEAERQWLSTRAQVNHDHDAHQDRPHEGP